MFDKLKTNDAPLRLLAIAIFVGLSILVAGLWWVQVIRYHTYTESGNNQSYRTVRIPAIRGKILDKNGLVLAENRPSYNVQMYIEELRPLFREEFERIRPWKKPDKPPVFWKRWLGMKAPDRVRASLSGEERANINRRARFNVAQQVANQVAAIIGEPVELDEEDFHDHYVGQRALPMTIFSNLKEDQLARFLESPRLPPSVDLEIQPARYYPHGSAAAHVIGHLGKDNRSQVGEVSSVDYRLQDYIGKVGVEGVFDPDLRGLAGVKNVLVNNMNYREASSTLFPAERGKDVVLTIDLPLQKAVEEALYEPAEKKPKHVRGAAIVMDARNGDVYALASAPAFDPNQFIPGISQAEMDFYNSPTNNAFFNRALQGQYHPGSIFKIMTALACLESGVLDRNTLTNRFYNPGFFEIGRRKIQDEAIAGHYDFERAFIKSSNTYFIHYALEAGFPPLQSMGMQFHFGEEITLPTRQNADGLFPSPDWLRQRGLRMSEGDIANLSIGQGYINVTPMQVAVAMAAIANGGTLVYPRIVDRVANPTIDGRVGDVEDYPRRTIGELDVLPEHLELIRNTMRKDVGNVEPGPNQGTGFRAEIPGMDICAKTGTAENKEQGTGRITRKDTWFASFAPRDNARYVVVVMVEYGDYGGTTCAPIAKKIYEKIQEREREGAFRNREFASTR